MSDVRDFDAFYLASASRLTRNIYLSTGDLGRAQDSVQEAYLRAWERWSAVGRGSDDPVAWVRTVAWRLAVDDWRGRARAAKAIVRRGPDPDAPPPSADVVAVRDALAELSREHRVVLVLHYFEDLPVRGFANLLDVPEGTVKARLFRGRAVLADRLDMSENEEDPSWIEQG